MVTPIEVIALIAEHERARDMWRKRGRSEILRGATRDDVYRDTGSSVDTVTAS